LVCPNDEKNGHDCAYSANPGQEIENQILESIKHAADGSKGATFCADPVGLVTR
jgi:hypothetical protein